MGIEGRSTVLPFPDERRLTRAEVRLLWSFVHGDIMDATMRDRLRASWGLCDRHSWGHAIVEIELWESGAGPSGGHQPFDVCVLYDDLLSTMLQRLRATASRRAVARLTRGTGGCPVCHDLDGPTVPGASNDRGYAGSDLARLEAEVNAMHHSAALARESADAWNAMVCPLCGDGRRSDGRIAEGPLCRRHLVDDREALERAVERARAELTRWTGPLAAGIDAMTQDGAPADAAARAAWIAVLGWFHGWELAVALAAGMRPTRPPRGRPIDE